MFKTTNDRSERDKIYALLCTKQIDDVITYEEIKSVLGRDLRINRTPFDLAAGDLLRNQKRAVGNIVDVGYRVFHPRENVHLSNIKTRRAARSLQRAIDYDAYADRALLNEQERAIVDAHVDHLKMQAASMRRTERALQRVTRGDFTPPASAAADADLFKTRQRRATSAS